MPTMIPRYAKASSSITAAANPMPVLYSDVVSTGLIVPRNSFKAAIRGSTCEVGADFTATVTAAGLALAMADFGSTAILLIGDGLPAAGLRGDGTVRGISMTWLHCGQLPL